MKRIEPESVGDVLRRTLQDQGMNERLYEAKAVAAWPGIVGEEMAAKCGKPYVANRVMNIYVRSAALRQELNMSRSILVRIINDTLGRDVIDDMRFK